MHQIKEWLAEYDEIKSRHNSFYVSVGVAGDMAAGKTTLLNSLLDVPEFLPSSSAQASTAVVCRVAWNHDHTEGSEYRAVVHFRHLDDIKKELDGYFINIKDRDDIQNKGFQGDWDDDEGLAEVNAKIQEIGDKVLAVWGLYEGDLEKTTTDEILQSKPQILQLLGRSKEIKCSDPEVFSEKIKPFLDSTAAAHGLTGEEEEFKAWPIIESVEVFLRADILKQGIELVDLPGLSDSTESRAATAERYYRKLAVTVIVAPTIRAADEKTATRLMTENQELRMQMDGKFHRKSFCVVLSKMDEINSDEFLRHSQVARGDSVLQEKLEELRYTEGEGEMLQIILEQKEKELLSIDKSLTQKAKAIQKLQMAKTSRDDERMKTMRNNKRNEVRQSTAQKDKVLKASTLFTQNQTKMEWLKGFKEHKAITIRNKQVIDRIRSDFKRRQKRVATEDISDLYDGTLEIFPVSANAYWKLKSGREMQRGFPDLLYAGVPRLRQWLFQITFPEREKHLGTTLHSMSRLFYGIQKWASTEIKTETGLPAYPRLRGDFLRNVHLRYLNKFKTVFDNATTKIKKLDPLKGKVVALDSCNQRCSSIIRRWSFKYPDNPASSKRIHWATYNCNLRANGGQYQSSGPSPYTYNWVESLTNPLLVGIVQDWNHTFHREIPDCEGSILKDIESEWDNYLTEVKTYVGNMAPVLQPHLVEIYPSLDGVKHEMGDRVRKCLKNISEGSAEVHPYFSKDVQEAMAPIFDQALKIRGEGMLRARQQMIGAFAEGQARDMFATAYNKMDTKLSENMKALPNDLGTIASFAVLSVQKQIKIVINSALGEEKDKMLKERKLKLQRVIQPMVVEWLTRWTVSDIKEDYVMSGVLDIPEEYSEQMMDVPKDGDEDKHKAPVIIKQELDDDDGMLVD